MFSVQQYIPHPLSKGRIRACRKIILIQNPVILICDTDKSVLDQIGFQQFVNHLCTVDHGNQPAFIIRYAVMHTIDDKDYTGSAVGKIRVYKF